MVRVRQQGSIRRSQIEPLRCSVLKVTARSLRGNFPVEISLGVLLSALVRLIDCDGNVVLPDLGEDTFVSENRRTVDDSIVSGAAKRMSVHGPDENALLLFGGNLLSLQQ